MLLHVLKPRNLIDFHAPQGEGLDFHMEGTRIGKVITSFHCNALGSKGIKGMPEILLVFTMKYSKLLISRLL